ncbi:MAG: hypothetical protein LBC86_04820 [Oscillospiraceae bacterium]|jgi:hypothetical protein|nr:hypothetical protein [Oscillospiraceae bacterium]
MNSSKSAFIATVVVALLAIAAAVFAFWNISEDEPMHIPDSEQVYRPPYELEDEMFSAAERLITNNHTLVRLYITHGIPVINEPYANTTDRPLGNPPEDGYFYSASSEFRTIEDVENLVRETFLADEAERVLNNSLDGGEPYYSEFGRIFGEKRANRDGITLGINEQFALAMHPYPKPNEDYHISWIDVGFDLIAISATRCELRIRLTINGEPDVIIRQMTNHDGEGWRLDRLVHE